MTKIPAPPAPPGENLLLDLLRDLQDAHILWQVAVIAAGLVTAWALCRVCRRRLAASVWGQRIDAEAFHRIVSPLAALLFILVGKTVLREFQPVPLLNLALPLLLSLLTVRAMAHLLRRVFAPGGTLKVFEGTMAWVIWIGVALHITGTLPEILHTLDEISITTGDQRMSLLLLIDGVVAVVVTVLVALWLGRVVESRLREAENLDANLRIALSKTVRALLVIFAALIALPAVGIDITALSVFGGALGVGLGFGLQKIASNYVSGFIILLDHSIRIGDLVTVNDRFGTVTQIRTRYTVVRSLDGTEAIIPNEFLISSTVVNHSFTKPDVRGAVQVQIAYSSSLEDAMAVMRKVAQAHPRVLGDPAAEVFLREFGDSGILLELGYWISDPEQGQLGLKSELNLAICRGFREHSIEIPFPQREVRILAPGSPAH